MNWKWAARPAGWRRILFVLLALAAVITMAPRMLEHSLLYFPTREVRGDPGLLGLPYEDLALSTADGVEIHGWFIPHEGGDRTLLILHGNAGNIGHRLAWMGRLHRLGVHLLIIDYRGFGKSGGRPREAGLYRDADAAYGWWERERKGRGEKLVLLGESLGGAVACNLAARVSPSGLILQSTFSSGRDMARRMFPLGLLQPLVGVRFDSAGLIAGVSCPKLFIHGTADTLVPIELGRKLYALAPEPKEFYAVTGAGHNDLVETGGAEYLQRLESFLARLR